MRALWQLLVYLAGLILGEAGIEGWPVLLACLAFVPRDFVICALLGQLHGLGPLWVADWESWLPQGGDWPLREAALAHLSQGLDHDDSRLLGGMVLGRTAAGFTLRDYPHWRDAGMAHLLVASGAQVTLFVLPLASLLTKDLLGVTVRRWIAALIAAQILVVLLLTGIEPSILRAATLTAWLLLAFVLGRPVDGLIGLYRTALFWLVLDPSLIHSASFQLSYAATWGMLLSWPYAHQVSDWLSSRISLRSLHGPVFWAITAAAATIGAQLAVLPVLWSWFGELQWQGFLANLVAVPLAEVVILAAALKVVLASMGLEIVGVLFNPALRIGLDGLEVIAHLFGDHPSPKLDRLDGRVAAALLAVIIALLWGPQVRRPSRHQTAPPVTEPEESATVISL